MQVNPTPFVQPNVGNSVMDKINAVERQNNDIRAEIIAQESKISNLEKQMIIFFGKMDNLLAK